MMLHTHLAGVQKVVVITGATKGIGLSLTRVYAAHGWTVVGCSRSEEGVASLAKELPSPHFFSVVDVSRDDQVSKWAQEVIKKYGAPDTLFNNAGVINRPANAWEISAQEFDNVIAVNVMGPANCIRHFVPAMIKRGQGLIINMSSVWGRQADTEFAPYCASKFAVEGLTKCLAQELPKGLIAVTLDPGGVNTEMLRKAIGSGYDFPTPEQWIVKAFPFIMQISSQDNGKTLIVH